ncbi:MAG: glycosyltransferase family 4 protein [Flavobacteriia bacterium]|nr:glycosyltransferase family 4 protein [Flavobacteriia bacterium]
MKIAINTRWLLKDRLEGIGWFTHSLVKRMVESHPEVEFHLIFDRKPDASYKYGPNVVMHTVRPAARHPYLWSFWNHFRVPSKLRKIKPDVYFSPDGMGVKNWEGKQLLAVHDLNFEHHPEWIPRKVGEWYQKHMVQYGRAADRIVCVSRETLEDVSRTWGISTSIMDVVYNAPQSNFKPLHHETPSLPISGKYFLCVGSINPRKNLALAVRAFSKYRLQGGDAELVLVGNHMHIDDELERVLEESPYRNKVHFVGRKHGNELNAIMSNSIALLFPSLFEGFGIPIVEAMAAGTPVICSNVSCMPEIAGDAAMLLSPLDADSWTDGMVKMEDESERKEWIEKGIERAKFFNWDSSAEKLWENIEKTVSNA